MSKKSKLDVWGKRNQIPCIYIDIQEPKNIYLYSNGLQVKNVQ